MALSSWVTTTTLPMLIIVPIIPAIGILILQSIIQNIICNKRLSQSGRTKAQIVQKYERGSKTYYKKDEGKSYFFICEWIIKNNETNKLVLCKSKFLVNKIISNRYNAGEFLELLYIPNNYAKYYNLKILNETVIGKTTIFKRVFISLLIIFIAPIIISILTDSWQIFLSLIFMGLLYYIIAYYIFICFCSHKTWFKNKSYKERKVKKIDLQRFGMDITSINEDNYNDIDIVVGGNGNGKKKKKHKKIKPDNNVKTTLLGPNNGISNGNKYYSIND